MLYLILLRPRLLDDVIDRLVQRLLLQVILLLIGGGAGAAAEEEGEGEGEAVAVAEVGVEGAAKY